MTGHFIGGLFHQAFAQGSRSTVLRPLGWLASILSVTLIFCIEFRAETWISIFIVVALGLTVILYMAAYIYCLKVDRDALRSETYSIQKMAIEKGVVGDNLTGMIDVPTSAPGLVVRGNAGLSKQEDQ